MATIYVNGVLGSASGPGTSPGVDAFKTINQGLAAMSGGDTFMIEAGIYREQIDLSGKGGINSTTRTTIKGRNGRFIVKGSEELTGLVRCTSAEADILGPDYDKVFKATVNKNDLPGGDPFAANLAENAEQLYICVDIADTSDPFFSSKNTKWHTADEVGVASGSISYIVDTSVTNNYTQAQIENARVVYVRDPNQDARSLVSSFDTGTNRINLADPYATPETSEVKDNWYFENILRNISKGTWGFVDNGADVTYYVWPHDEASVGLGLIEYSKRNIGINLGGASNIEMTDFEVHGVATSSKNTAPILNTSYANHVTLLHFAVRASAMGADGYAALYLNQIDNLELGFFEVKYARDLFGMFLQGTGANNAVSTLAPRPGLGDSSLVDQMTNIYIHDFVFDYVSSAPIRAFTCRNIAIVFGTFTNCSKATHGNTINFYQGCHNFLVWGINAEEADGFCTWQESDSGVIGMSAFSASTAPNGGARAIYSQQNSSIRVNPIKGTEHPGTTYGFLGSYLINCRGIPNPLKVLDSRYQNGIKASSNADDQDFWSIYNLIHHGDDNDFAMTLDWDNNLNTGPAGTTYGPNDQAQAHDLMYVDAPNDNFMYRTGSKARVMAGKNLASIVSNFPARWPHIPASVFTLDMAKAPINWNDAFMGPVGDMDYNYRSTPSVGEPVDPPVVPDPLVELRAELLKLNVEV